MSEAIVGVLGVILGAVLQRHFYQRDIVAEQKRQKRAVAKAVLFEIDGFFRYYIRDTWKFVRGIDPDKDTLPAAKSISPNPFPVFYANAGQLGLLDDDTVEAVVGLYGTAASHVSTLPDYRTALNRTWTPGANVALASREARLHLRHMKASLPAQIELAQSICRRLCEVAGIAFEQPRIGAAAKDLFANGRESTSS